MKGGHILPTPGSNVKFKSGTYSEYASITPDSNTIYFLDDNGKHRIFVGSAEYCPSEEKRKKLFFFTNGLLSESYSEGYRFAELTPGGSYDEETSHPEPYIDVNVGDQVVDGSGRLFLIDRFLDDGNDGVVFTVIDLNFNIFNRTSYSVCSSISETVKSCTTGSTQSFFPIDGSIISVKFTESGLGSGATLNVNYSGDYPIYYRNSPIIGNYIFEGDTVTFVFYNLKYYVISIDSYMTRPEVESIFIYD